MVGETGTAAIFQEKDWSAFFEQGNQYYKERVR